MNNHEAKDPAVLLYTSDFLTGVADLTMEERGQYITLLCMQHQKGRLSEKTCRLLLGFEQVSEVADVLAKFKIDEDGNYYNERMEKEILKRSKSTDANRENGKKGGRPRKDNKNPNETRGFQMGKPNQNPSENEDINENDNKNKDINSRVFEGRNFSEQLQAAVSDWLRYKKEKKQEYKPTGLKSLLTQIENKLNMFSEQQIMFAITESMSSNYQGIVWDYAKNYTKGNNTDGKSNGKYADKFHVMQTLR